MVSLSPVLNNFATDTWVKASWEDFLAVADDPSYTKGRFYYYQGYMRIEMAAVGPRHGRHNSIISKILSLFAMTKNIRIVELTNTSFRKEGLKEFQPDLAYYIGSGLSVPPEDSDSPVNLNQYEPPSLVVEIGASSFGDDLGRKRLIYERSGVREYWVVDARARSCIALEIDRGRSGEIQESQVLPGLTLAIVAEALERSQSQDDGEIMRWLLETFSAIDA